MILIGMITRKVRQTKKTKSEEVMKRFRSDVMGQREKYQPSTMENIFATLKAIILRALAFYFLMWFFKRNNGNPGGGASTNPSEDIHNLEKEDNDFMDKDEF